MIRTLIADGIAEERTNSRQAGRQIRKLEKKRAKSVSRYNHLLAARTMIDFIDCHEVETAYLERLQPEDFISVFLRAYAYTYFEDETDCNMATHWMWRTTWAKEIAYERLGRRRLLKKNRTKEMIAHVMCTDAERRGFQFFHTADLLWVRFPKLCCFLNKQDTQSISCLLQKIEEYGREMNYERFGRKRVMLAAWRLQHRVSRAGLRGN